jgi:hypothetical protein
MVRWMVGQKNVDLVSEAGTRTQVLPLLSAKRPPFFRIVLRLCFACTHVHLRSRRVEAIPKEIWEISRRCAASSSALKSSRLKSSRTAFLTFLGFERRGASISVSITWPHSTLQQAPVTTHTDQKTVICSAVKKMTPRRWNEQLINRFVSTSEMIRGRVVVGERKVPRRPSAVFSRY